MKLALPLFLLAASASAQLPAIEKIRVRVGYFASPNFNTSVGSRSLRGPEIGVDLPVFSLAGFDLSVSPAISFGGGFGSGSDFDGQIFRIAAAARRNLPTTRFFLTGALGYGFVQSRGGWSGAESGAYVEFGVGYGLSRIPAPVRPVLELRYRAGGRQVSGLFAGLSVGF